MMDVARAFSAPLSFPLPLVLPKQVFVKFIPHGQTWATARLRFFVSAQQVRLSCVIEVLPAGICPRVTQEVVRCIFLA